MTDANDRIRDLLAVESIPPLPGTAATLLAMAADPDVSIDDLAHAIERDPPLSARVLGLANSAFYAPRQPVTTVKSAIITVLGLNMVRNIAFGLSLTGGLSTRSCPQFDLGGYWVVALGTADLASGLARAATLPEAPDPDAVYLSGLLHNIGELLMVHLWPEAVGRILRAAAVDPGSRLEDIERETVGLDHWQVGGFLARHWELPAFVARHIEQLGDDKGIDDDVAGMLLRSARRWVDGVMAGHPDALRIRGVDETYCEYRSTTFLDRYDALRALARNLS